MICDESNMDWNMKSHMNMAAACLGAAFCLTVSLSGCVMEEPASGPSSAVVTFVPQALETRGSYAADESRIADLNIFVYRDGLLANAAYAESGAPLSMSLLAGGTYSLFAIANAGEEIAAPVEVSGMYGVEVPVDYDAMETGGMPMSAVIDGFEVTPAGQEIKIGLVRLFAKYGFRVDKGRLSASSYVFTSVRLMQTASSLRPFGDNAASSGGDVMDGDRCSPSEIDKLNAGEELFFYVPENMQGTLLPDNADPWGKVPDSIGDKDGLCTYIQADAVYSADGASGNVGFRFYLGSDDCSNFDVRRNSVYHIVLYPDDDSPYVLGWKMDSDVEWDDGVYSLVQPSNVGGWGSLKVHGASGDRVYMVRVKSGADEAEFALGLPDASETVCGAYLFHYNPSEPEDLYFMPTAKVSGGYSSDMLPELSISRGSSSISARVTTAPVYPDFTFARGLVTNEDGYGVVSELRMGTPLTEFAAPRAVLSALPADMSDAERKWHYFKSVFYDDFVVSVADEGTFSEGDDPAANTWQTEYSCAEDVTLQRYRTVYDAWEDGVFAVVGLYGLKAKDNAATVQTFVPYHVGLTDPEGGHVAWTFDFTVEPAFPEWRYIGRYENMQFAPVAPSSDVEISFAGKDNRPIPTGHASWEIRHGKFDTHDVDSSLETAWKRASNDAYSMDISMDSGHLSFPLAPRNGLCCGPMVCRGQVTNRVSGRVIYGYYTLDLVMNLSIGARVSANGRQSAYCFAPFTEYASPEYYDLWEKCLPRIHIKHMMMKAENLVDTEYLSYVGAQQYTDAVPWKWPLQLYHIGRELYNDSDVEELVELYDDLAGNAWFDFNFYDEGSAFISKTLTIDAGTLHLIRGGNVFVNSSSEYYQYRDGDFGYYVLYKQHKIKDIPETEYCDGLQNYLLEAALGNFVDY